MMTGTLQYPTATEEHDRAGATPVALVLWRHPCIGKHPDIQGYAFEDLIESFDLSIELRIIHR